MKISESVSVDKEGVYYTYFIFESISDPQRLLDTSTSSKQASTLLRRDKSPHLTVQGTIWYENSSGYLNAE